ncbi:MAG: hypothetical protein RBU30_21685, partial [Polyangia bacterium]|nr:hypothetical protein [Polyangia bacterium]
LALLQLASCEKDGIPEKYKVEPSELRANLKNAALIALVAEGGDPGQQAERTSLRGVRKNGVPLCEDLSVEELEALEPGGGYENDCVNPEPLSYCQEIHPERLATGRVICQERPWRAGELMAVDHSGEAFSVLPFLPEWNQVLRVQQSEGALLVTLAYPMKLLRSDETVDYCHVLYYPIDTGSDSIVPYCFEYEYRSSFCFGPDQKEWQYPIFGTPPWCVNNEGLEVEYTEALEHLDGGLVVCASPPVGPPIDCGEPHLAVHLTPYAIFESYGLGSLPSDGYATRIVTGAQEAHYPMEIDLYTTRGIISAGTYYSFDASYESISGALSSIPIHWNDSHGRAMTHESGHRILYGHRWNPGSLDFGESESTTDSTTMTLHFFDSETLEDGSFLIDVSPHPHSSDIEHGKWWHFMAAIGDYLFYYENNFGESIFYRVDTRSPHPIIEELHRNPGWSDSGRVVIMYLNGWAIYAPSEVPFVAFIFRPDGTMSEVNAEMLGFNPQTLEVEDDLIVVNGMDGLTPRRFVIHPLATAEGELLVETAAETIQVRTLIPLAQ